MRIWGLLLCLALSVSAAEPIKLDNLLTVLQRKNVPVARLVQLIEDSGIDFKGTDDELAKLKTAGASQAYSAGGVTHYRHKTEMPFDDWSNPDTGRISQNPETNPVAGFPNLRLASNSGNSNGIVTCLTCHRVHGTNSTMAGYALKGSLGGLADEDLSPAQTSTSRSVLLFTDNRGMCQACHQWGVTP